MRSIIPALSVLSLAFCACRPASEPEEVALAELTPSVADLGSAPGEQFEGRFVFSIDGMKKINGAL